MESFFKLLYTGVTRCCNRLMFVETEDKPASRAFFRWLKTRDFAEPYVMVPESHDVGTSSQRDALSSNDLLEEDSRLGDVSVYMSNDEWRLRGIDLILAADQDSRSKMKMFKNALLCFERAGELVKHLKTKVHVHMEAEVLKDKFMNYFRTTRGAGTSEFDPSPIAPPDFTAGMPDSTEVAVVILKCIKQGLLQEALDLASLMGPCLADTPIAKYFDAEISGRLKLLRSLGQQ